MSWELAPASHFAEHAPTWRALHADGCALLAVEFVQALLDAFGDGSEWLAQYRQAGQVVVMTIVRTPRRGIWETFQPSQAPITLWLEQPGAVAPRAMARLLDRLMAVLPGSPLLLSLTQRDPALHPSPLPRARLRVAPYVDTARIALAGTFDDFWLARGKNLRANMKKQRARLAREGTATRLDITRDGLDMTAAVRDFGQLESAGWKAGHGTAIDGANAQGRFYRAMLTAMAQRGAASAYRYWLGDRLVAMNLCVADGQHLIILKTTYDETLDAHYTPAFLMLEEMCRQQFAEQQLDGIEFYGKVMDWHRRWSDDVRTLYHVNHYRVPGLESLHRLYGRWQQRHTPRPPPAAIDAIDPTGPIVHATE